MPAELYALILLVFRIIAVSLLVNVIDKQIKLRKRPIRDKRAQVLREEMLQLTLVALAMNIIPIVVDVLALFGRTTRSSNISWLSVAYVFSYSIGSLVLTRIIYRMYRKSLEY